MPYLLLFPILFFLGACGSTDRPLQSADKPTGEISVAIRVGKIAAASISRAEIVITATGMAQMRQALTISGNTITGTVRGIPAGTGRLFTLNGYDASGSLTYTGSATATVVAGETVQVRIAVRSTAATGKPILSVQPTVSTEYYDGTTTITVEIANTGTAAATGVAMWFRARNAAGAAISDANASIGTVEQGTSKLVPVRFSNTTWLSSGSRSVAEVEYGVSYNEGNAIRGTLTVKL